MDPGKKKKNIGNGIEERIFGIEYAKGILVKKKIWTGIGL
jgi:hypothetical protein